MDYEKHVAYTPDEDAPTNLLEFNKWLNDVVAGIPEDYRASATIEITAYDHYGDMCVSIDVGYNRPMLHHEIIQHRMLNGNPL